MAKTRVKRKNGTCQRTAPYLGVACLALLALASLHALAPEGGAAVSAGRAPGASALNWLAAPSAPQPLAGAAAQWIAPGATLAAAQSAFALAGAALLGFALARSRARTRARLRRRPHDGSLATPALLIAVALARAH